MKFVTYADPNGGARIGSLHNNEVFDLGFDGDMVAFIERGAPVDREISVGTPRLLAPLKPRTLRDFLGFEGHLLNAYSRLGREIPDEWYTVPAYYKGLPETVIGPDDELPWPTYAKQLDYELEVAAVIGTPGRSLTAQTAAAHIFGYTLWNDMSARDTQRSELPVGMGPGKAKDWDGSNVLGPCIVTPDEIDISDLHLSVFVNGVLKGSDSTANMHHSFDAMIAYASADLTLRPGEVFGAGTVAGGSGMELDSWLEPGDLIEMHADGIGTLRNRVGPHNERK
jgi:2-keto-4-pentenoate hydratase/2-oxohepta-3-ene-1,7-dioic acid hydratase in catechol pathway